jgi:hypothetical protein
LWTKGAPILVALLKSRIRRQYASSFKGSPARPPAFSATRSSLINQQAAPSARSLRLPQRRHAPGGSIRGTWEYRIVGDAPVEFG